VEIAGFEIPSDSPVFLAVLAIHVPIGLPVSSEAMYSAEVLMRPASSLGVRPSWRRRWRIIRSNLTCLDRGKLFSPGSGAGTPTVPS
jgi:hypothetical protein